MFLLNGVRIYLARQPVDLRKSIDGLSLLVSQVLGEDPFSAQLFVFTNRRRDKLKALHYDANGFALYYKHLERGRFCWPVSGPSTRACASTIANCSGCCQG